MNTYIFLLAGVGAWFILAQLARLAWHLLDRAALHLYIRRNRYRLEIRDRLDYYV